MSTSVLRLVCGLACLALALVGLSVAPSRASASPRTAAPGKHAVASASQGASLRAALHEDARSESWAGIAEDDDDDDDDDDDGDSPDPDEVGPTSRLPLPGPSECSDTDLGFEPTGRAMPGARELPEDPP